MTNKGGLRRGSASTLAVVIAALGAHACASERSDQKSGETHFLCKSDADCAKLGAGYYCPVDYCVLRPDGGGEDAAVGGSSERDGSGGAAVGAAGWGGSRGDGGSRGGAGGGSPGTGGVNHGGAAGTSVDAGKDSGTDAGDFAMCQFPPESNCAKVDFCHAIGGCGTTQLDENGCSRTPCSHDT